MRNICQSHIFGMRQQLRLIFWVFIIKQFFKNQLNTITNICDLVTSMIYQPASFRHTFQHNNNSCLLTIFNINIGVIDAGVTTAHFMIIYDFRNAFFRRQPIVCFSHKKND